MTNKTNTYTPPKNIEEAFAECQPSINKLVRRWTRNHYWMREELQQEAAMAVCRAWHKYDRTKANKFSTYAYQWISALCSEYAQPAWERMNAECEFSTDRHDDYYDLNVDNAIDVEKKLAKVDPIAIEVYHLRMEGETFDTIANRLPGIRNLQHARNTYIEVQDRLKETY